LRCCAPREPVPHAIRSTSADVLLTRGRPGRSTHVTGNWLVMTALASPVGRTSACSVESGPRAGAEVPGRRDGHGWGDER
jgi:hypothetical protein